MQGTGRRRLNLKVDVVISGVTAAVWRLDSMTDMEVVYIILAKVQTDCRAGKRCLSLVLSSVLKISVICIDKPAI